MENLKLDFLKYQVPQTSPRPINLLWEQANEFGKYVGIPTPMVLRMIKKFGPKKVFSMRSWLYDIPFDPKRGGKIALAYWRLKQMK